MEVKPILFSAPMVQAIMREIKAPGTGKTQTRRIIKSQFQDFDENGWPVFEDGDGFWNRVICPYGKPGDLLYVRETWAHYQTVNHIRHLNGAAFSEISDGLAGYRADGFDSIEDFRNHICLMSGHDLEAVEINGDRWRPSIHMPRWASRITLEITDVKVQRLQDISEQDAFCEGAMVEDYECQIGEGYSSRACYSHGQPGDEDGEWFNTAKLSFEDLWKSMYGPESWDRNDWVWAVSFKPHLVNVDKFKKVEA